MAGIYRTAQGKMIDMDLLRLQNEQTIAIGNQKVNARGDELGQGGEIVRTKAEILADYHKLNTPMPDNSPLKTASKIIEDDFIDPEDLPLIPAPNSPEAKKTKGNK